MWLKLIVIFAICIVWVSAENGEEAPLVAVYAIRGKSARLPCNITSPEKDSVVLVLWYKNGTKTPVYSVDSRNKPLSEGKPWTSKEVFGNRASFETSEGLSHLVVKETKFSDEGLFRCRVDFRTTPTHIGRVNLHVVDPPRSVHLFTTDGSAVGKAVSGKKGQPLALVCRASGGDPVPKVNWWINDLKLISKPESFVTKISKTSHQTDKKRLMSKRKIKSSSLTNTGFGEGNKVYELIFPENVLSDEIAKGENISCTASNNPEIDPLAASVRLIQVGDAPMSVDMTAPPNPLIGGKEYEVHCEAEGVQPPPTITWLLGGKKLTENIITQRLGADRMQSILRLKAGYADDRTRLECQATAPSMPQVKDTHAVTLHVNYVPEAKIRLTNPKKFPADPNKEITDDVTAKGFSESQSAEFVCQTKANPPTYNITFLFNGRPLHQELRAVTKGPKLTLLNLTHSDAGLYTCVASNSVGDGQSNAVGLHINYAPVCKRAKPKEMVALNGEIVKLQCDVVASPKMVQFDWRVLPKGAHLEKLGSSPVDHSDEETLSQGSFQMTNSSNQIIVKCWASNKVGATKKPCVFDITLVDVPGPLIGCKQDSVTSYSANITCSPGTTGGLVLKFHLQVKDIDTEKVIYKTTSQTPKFSVTTLDPGRTYAFVFYASHSKGKGQENSLIVRTLNPQAEEVVNPNLGEPPTAQNPSPVAPSHPIHTLVPVSLVVGIAAGVIVGIALVIAVVVRCRWRHIYHRKPPGEGASASHGGMSSRESLLDLRDTSAYQSCSPTLNKEHLTSFSPEPIVVTSIPTSSLASHSSSPVPIISTPVNISSSQSTPSVSPRLKRGRRSLRFKDTDTVRRIDPNSESGFEDLSNKPTSDVEKSYSDGAEIMMTSRSNIRDKKYSSNEGPDLLCAPVQESSSMRSLSDVGLKRDDPKMKGCKENYFASTEIEGLSPAMLSTAPPPVYYNPPVVFHQQPRVLSPSNYAQHSPTIFLHPQQQFDNLRPLPPPRDGSFLTGSPTQISIPAAVPPPSTFSSANQPVSYSCTLPRSSPNFSNQGLGWRVENLRKMELIRQQHNKERESGAESGSESVIEGSTGGQDAEASSLNEPSSSRRSSNVSLTMNQTSKNAQTSSRH